jgi:hypothetical protein
VEFVDDGGVEFVIGGDEACDGVLHFSFFFFFFFFVLVSLGRSCLEISFTGVN